MAQTITQLAMLLVKLHGQGSRTVPLEQDVFTIGRKADNSLMIEDHTVSGHHARIVKVQAVFFVEDLKSTNGTMVNGQRVERHQLHDADVITIGAHKIIFQDPVSAPAAAPSAPADLDQTMVLRGTDRQQDSPTATAKVLVTGGKTDRMEYQLTKQVNAIGSQDQAAIKLTGWFAPKSAALISRRGQTFSISPTQGGKTILVNGQEVTGEQELKDGDEIRVAGVSMSFYLHKTGSR